MTCSVYNKRHRNDPKPPKFKTELVRRSLLYRGPHEWMNLDAEIQTATAKEVFKDKFHKSKHVLPQNKCFPIQVLQPRNILSFYLIVSLLLGCHYQLLQVNSIVLCVCVCVYICIYIYIYMCV